MMLNGRWRRGSLSSPNRPAKCMSTTECTSQALRAVKGGWGPVELPALPVPGEQRGKG